MTTHYKLIQTTTPRTRIMNMAFFMNMPGVAVLLLLLILPPPLFIAADNKLIQTLCHNSETPETCMRCVQSSKKAVNVNSTVGVAMIVINCIKDKANALALNMTKLASTSNGHLKSICKKCAKDYGHHIAKKEFFSSKHALRNHRYDKAESAVARALSIDLACHSILTSLHHDEVPSHVFDGMKTYEELSEAACRIMEKIYE
ncbi:hypothetical protein AAZX31_08G166700 [Glycine max]|uniref:Pectinesterase inhibitor domain-containing protein n=2 Tax=Glycine subgen. Soja TaxID=1462606 RepID=A0A445JFR5_GLYSO|nr:uncharacterized protein LOC114420886 [Glycine soja]KAG4399079.1 hypothetical protein GLYMA_08G168633v4 [Glycine max]KAH1051620.1 hypothetical protein GYH30_021494 [Glycine max]RZB97281.1 hypothetical protein D0Y65_020784 [Glycine soja]